MPAVSSAPTCVRSAAVVNREITALAGRVGLTGAERAVLARLWAEWCRAHAREQAAREAELAA